MRKELLEIKTLLQKLHEEKCNGRDITAIDIEYIIDKVRVLINQAYGGQHE